MFALRPDLLFDNTIREAKSVDFLDFVFQYTGEGEFEAPDNL
jgi:hypothetical protein